MIIVTHNLEPVAYAKSVDVVNKYFKLRASHGYGKTYFLNRLIYSKKFGIEVKLTDDKQEWNENYSIKFLKELKQIEDGSR
jgi:hypothetical protein